MKTNLKLCAALFSIMSIQSVSAAVVGDPEWAYPDANAPNGQSSWSLVIDTLSTAPVPLNYPYTTCGIGTKQSPVDIKSADFVPGAGLATINFFYHTEALAVLNNGHTIMVQESQTRPGKLYFGNNAESYDEYTLVQFHLHSPSEHTLNGASFPMELHFVHSTPDGKTAVVSVVVALGAFNTELQKILQNAPTTVSTEASMPADVSINPSNLLPNTKTYLSYAGSLTTPPCTQGVNWFIMGAAIEASQAQITHFEKLIQIKNARNTNSLNGRVINFKP